MVRLLVKTKSKQYNVYIGREYINTLNELINKSQSKVLYLIDKNVSKKCSTLVDEYIPFQSDIIHKMIISSSESNKSLKTVEKIFDYLHKNNFDRKGILVSIGGGVLGDIAGLTASMYRRGIKFIQIPTTILSAVDSSVGGKTGVNFNQVKNLIGSFYHPEAVFINPEFFKTLPKLEIISGIGELIKYSLLVANHYDFYKEEVKRIFSEYKVSDLLISTSIKFKSEVVRNDEKEETGLRKILNLGHTFAHGIESASNYKLKHGEAVFFGLICSFLISEKLGFVNKGKTKLFLNDFSFIPIRKILLDIDNKSIINFMKSDKKNTAGSIMLVLPYQDKFLIDFPIKERYILEALEKLKDLIK